jgi:hypothetical protein
MHFSYGVPFSSTPPRSRSSCAPQNHGAPHQKRRMGLSTAAALPDFQVPCLLLHLHFISFQAPCLSVCLSVRPPCLPAPSACPSDRHVCLKLGAGATSLHLLDRQTDLLGAVNPSLGGQRSSLRQTPTHPQSHKVVEPRQLESVRPLPAAAACAGEPPGSRCRDFHCARRWCFLDG